MTAAYGQETEKQWVPATPLDAIQFPALRCRVKDNDDSEWKESTLVGWDRSDEYQWACSDCSIQWAKVCEVWKEPGCMRIDIKTLCDWIHMVECGIEPPLERTVKVGDIANKYRQLEAGKDQ